MPLRLQFECNYHELIGVVAVSVVSTAISVYTFFRLENFSLNDPLSILSIRVAIASLSGAVFSGIVAGSYYRFQDIFHSGSQGQLQPHELPLVEKKDAEQKQILKHHKTFQERLEDIQLDANEIPSYLTDRVTLEIMNEPVIFTTGQSVDQETAKRIVSPEGNKKCPITLKPVTDFFPNHALRCAIIDFVSSKEKEHKDNLKRKEKKQDCSEEKPIISPLRTYSILSRKCIDSLCDINYKVVMRKKGG